MNCRYKKPLASVRLICFPWAGGGTTFFTQWGRHFTDDIEVSAVCLPGREGRSDEQCCSTKDETIDWIVQTLHRDFSDKPFAFYGHSMGAVLCFWVAFELKRRYDKQPVHMFLTGAQPPHTQGFHNVISRPDDEFLRRASSRAVGGLPKDVMENQEKMDLFLPVWKADLALLRDLGYSYNYKAGGKAPLSCSVDLFCGQEEEPDVVNYLNEWNDLTSGNVSKHFMEGDHFFLTDETNMKKLQSFIESKLEDADN